MKVDHGNVAEEIFRNYRARFLPKKYGVAKGHILTHDLTYDGPLEEWDLIVYDISESPVLFVRDESGATPRLGIPRPTRKRCYRSKGDVDSEQRAKGYGQTTQIGAV